MNDTHQRRYLPARRPELLARTDQPDALPVIAGYAAVFYREGDPTTEYEMWPAESGYPRVVERIAPSAFNRAVKEDDVRALFNHDPDTVLGRSGAGTLRLSVDAVGLRYEIDPPDTQAARDLIQSLRRGDITGSSFAFLPRNTAQRKTEAAGEKPAEMVIVREDVQLFDVGPVTFPAYAGANSGVRAAESDRNAIRAEVGAIRAAVDSAAVAVALAIMEAEISESE